MKDIQALRDHHSRVRVADAALTFSDPTRSLTSAASGLLEIDDGQLDALIQALDEKRLLLLTCVDDQVLYSAAHAIAARRSGWECREVLFGDFARVSDRPVRLSALVHPKVGETEKALIFVFASSQASDDFLDTLPKHSAEYARVHSRLMESRQIVVLVSPKRLSSAGLGMLNACPYSESIDFVAPRVRPKYSTTWTTLAAGLRQQYQQGLWGENEESFLDRLERSLQANTLDSDYELRERALRDPAIRVSIWRPRSAVPSVIADDRPLETAISFAGAYFKRLRVEDFQRVLTVLIGETLEPRLAHTPTGITAGAELPPRLLKQIWLEQRGRLLRECGLRIFTRPSVVDFDHAEDRAEVQRQFESENYFAYDDLCNRVDLAGFVFYERREVAEAAMDLVLHRIQLDPAGYGEVFLDRVLGPFGGTRAGDRTKSAVDALDRVESADRLRVLARVALLLSRAFQDGAAASADAALRGLVDRGRHRDVLNILSRIGDVSFVERKILLSKRLIDEGDEWIRDTLGEQLFRWALEGGARTRILVDTLGTWEDNSSAPHATALSQLLPELVEWSITSSTSADTHPIASALTSTASDGQARAFTTRIANLAPAPLAEDFLGVQHAAILLLSFLWILPRPIEHDHGDSEAWLWGDVQSAWFHGFTTSLDSLLRASTPGTRYERTFAALALADCVIALSGDEAALQKALARVTTVLHTLSGAHRAALRANWHAMDQGLLRCIAVPSLFQSAVKSERSHHLILRERWKSMRTGIGRLLNALAESAH